MDKHDNCIVMGSCPIICADYTVSAHCSPLAKEREHFKWYYDQKIIPFFYSDFKSVFAEHPAGKILSFAFYPKAVYFECKFRI